MRNDPGLDFEHFMQLKLPYKLNVSGAKQVALRIRFSRFADSVRPLARKAPEEFNYFMDEFEKTINSVECWRPPKGKIVRPAIYRLKGELVDERWTNGKSRYRLWDKPPPSPHD